MTTSSLPAIASVAVKHAIEPAAPYSNSNISAELSALKINENVETQKEITNGENSKKSSVSSIESQPIFNKMKRLIAEKKPFYSFEYFPPKTREGVENLYTRLERMATLEPLFMDVTWGAGGSTADLTLEISGAAQQLSGSCEVMMHLTCTNIRIEEVRSAIEKAKQLGIRNILALRGDPPKGQEVWEKTEGGFGNAIDLVKCIRNQYGNYFGIAVAGYPEGHIACESLEKDIQYLKDKCDAGADFIITQLFYDVDLFLDWVKKCRAVGITCPIIPGIMPIQNYNSFVRMTGFCKTAVPQEIWQSLEPIKDNDEQVKEYGIKQCIEMCSRLLKSGEVHGLHFYTLNLERSVRAVLEGLGFITPKPLNGMLPWKQSQVIRRAKEQVRPIFWSNRPRSYLERTVHWDDFPNGRWGDAASPAFGDLSDYHLCNFRVGSVNERKKIWGESLEKLEDVYKVFSQFVRGEISRLPWCDTGLQLETMPLTERLSKINEAGYLTINSQPRVNGAKSSDPAVGWGGPGGYVYQKAYIEFFCSKDNLNRLIKAMDDSKYNSLVFTAVTSGGECITSLKDQEHRVNAVTWGVFPNREILQPTIVDVDVFISAWKTEAFALWTSVWGSIYDENSKSRELINKIHSEFYLVNIVENDYMQDTLYPLFEELLGLKLN